MLGSFNGIAQNESWIRLKHTQRFELLSFFVWINQMFKTHLEVITILTLLIVTTNYWVLSKKYKGNIDRIKELKIVKFLTTAIPTEKTWE